MREFWKGFFLRGTMAAGLGPLVLAAIYGTLGALGHVTLLTPRAVCLGILSVTVLAFVVAGMNAIYQVERLPLGMAIMLHGAGLYVAYIAVYLINGWLQKQLTAIFVFTGIFLTGYGVIWLIIFGITKRKTKKVNRLLQIKGAE